MNTYPKRLIEVDLPIKRISAHARREKSIRHGHISTLHIWWARRPLASCRAVICAALWPDPADDLCPQRFRDDAFRIMTELRDRVAAGLLSEDLRGAREPVGRIRFPKDPGNLVGLRHVLLDFIAEFANWDLSTNRFFLDTSRALTQSAHEALGGAPGTRPLVVDPFAGGGSIPLEALRVLETLPPAELERLLTETLDACTHRLDAWVTALVTRRLDEMRLRRPLGVHLGAYGWVEDLRPAAASRFRAINLPGGVTGRVQSLNGGYIYAPSMSHTAAAAILRSAWLTRSDAGQGLYGIDLSSQRVRAALWVLDCVREGQALGAVLGYRFERGLHEGHASLSLDKYIDPFRRLYPLVANKKDDSDGPAETVAARNVVDGLALRKAWRENSIPFGSHGLPGAEDDQAAIREELRRLDDCADALADLLLAESVHQIVRGNMSASVASLDALAQGLRPPSPEIAEQPRSGTPLVHRLCVVLGGDPLPEGPWASIPATPRSIAEPYLDRWAGQLLGDPAMTRARVSFLDPIPADPLRRTELVIRLDQLGLRPIDLLSLARTVSERDQGGELDRRIAWFVQGGAPSATEIRIEYAPDPTWDRRTIRSMPELLEMGHAILELLSTARPLQPEDLLRPEDTFHAADADRMTDEATDADRMTDELVARADAALTDPDLYPSKFNSLPAARKQLNDAVTAIDATPEDSAPDLTALREALRLAADFGIAGAFPKTRQGSTSTMRAELLQTGQSVLSELDRRLGEANSLPPKSAVDKLKAVFGRDFLVLPRFRLAGSRRYIQASEELAQALAAGPSVVRAPANVVKWLQQAAPVHLPLARWRKLAAYSQALNGLAIGFDVAQLPYEAGKQWAALPFVGEENRPAARRLSLVMHRAQAPTADQPWVGLVFHEWTELIPSMTEQTAVAFHYDDPGAEAPQTILLAVPSDPGAHRWDFDALLSTLHETLELAKIRAVDSELLGLLGQLLPSVYVAENAESETVSVEFTAMRQAETTVAEA